MFVINRVDDGIFHVLKNVINIKSGDSILINGALGFGEFFFDLWIGIFVALFKRNVILLISDATWHPRTVEVESRVTKLFKLYSWFQKRLLLMCESPTTHYCFLSRAEVDLFVQETGIESHRVHFTKFSSQLPLENLDELLSIANISKQEKYVFSGGNSLRDYDTLLGAVDGLDICTVIASSNSHVFDNSKVEFKYFNQKDYFKAMAASAIVVVPLIETERRSVGQQTYLNAMALGKLTIISDVIGVRDYVEADSQALLVPPNDVNALRDRITWALDLRNSVQVDAIARSGRVLAEQMTFAHYCRNLEDLLRRIGSPRFA